MQLHQCQGRHAHISITSHFSFVHKEYYVKNIAGVGMCRLEPRDENSINLIHLYCEQFAIALNEGKSTCLFRLYGGIFMYTYIASEIATDACD